MLTINHKRTIDNIAKLTGDVSLYRETSLTGKSETLRYIRRWQERRWYGYAPRQHSGMILSVKINVMPNGDDDPESITKYNSLCDEAIAYFNTVRKS